MKTYGGVDVEIHVSLTSAVVGGERSATHLNRFTPEEVAVYPQEPGWPLTALKEISSYARFLKKFHGLNPLANSTDRATVARPFLKKTPWSESASELYRPSDRRLSAKWLPTFADRDGQRDGSLWPYFRFSVQEPLLFYQVAPQLYSQGWMDPVPDPQLFFPGSTRNRTRAFGSVHALYYVFKYRFQGLKTTVWLSADEPYGTPYNYNSVALVRKRIIPTERPPLVGEVVCQFLRIEGCRLVSSADLLLP
jgi:hypothetical protein